MASSSSASCRVVLAAIALAVAAPAYAEDKVVARQAFDEGAKDYDTAQFAKALDAFTKAYFNYSDPNILYNIAQCHRALGQRREAIDSYRSYLRKSPSAPNRPEVERIIGELNAQLDAETVKAAPLVSTPAPALIVSAPVAPEKKPVYRRAWFWGAVAGGVVAVGLGVGLGVGLTRSHAPHSDGTVTF